MDFSVTKLNSAKQLHVVLAIGNGSVIALRLNMFGEETQTEELARYQMCDIKLLSCFIIEIDEKLDILAANGRSELIKVSLGGDLDQKIIFKADQKV